MPKKQEGREERGREGHGGQITDQLKREEGRDRFWMSRLVFIIFLSKNSGGTLEGQQLGFISAALKVAPLKSGTAAAPTCPLSTEKRRL